MRHSSLSTTFGLSLIACVLLLALPSCSTRPDSRSMPPANLASSSYTSSTSSAHIPMDTNGGYYKVGKPYRIKGKTYHPNSSYSYNRTGIASWYGQRFHNKKTANGEIFNKNELTAAHKTLPLPCLARVTNLENGKSIVVRVNDRGPFSGKRIIDLSQRAAQLLNFERKGIAKVRVQVLKEESKAIADAMRSYGTYAKRKVKPQPVQQVNAVQPYLQPQPYENTKKLRIAKVETSALPPLDNQQSIARFKPAPIVEQVDIIGDNNIYVQAGAFTDLSNARRLQAKLSPLGQTVMAQAVVKDVRYYRVRLGPIASVSIADRMVDQVIRSGASDEARIVVD